jgi:predicted amidohydrolase YtcJ
VTELKAKKMRWFWIAVTGLFLLLSLGYWAWFGNHSPHRVFINANVLTVNQNNDIAEAVSIRHGIIEAVGSNESIQALIDDDTLVSDLAGNTLVAGFIDAHSHFPSSGLTAAGLSAVSVNLRSPPVGEIRSIEDIRLALSGELAHADSDNWIIGLGYDDSLLAEQRHPTRLELDELSSDIPIYLWHSSGHMGVANSAGLRKLGFDEDSTAPVGGVIGRDPRSGRLNGLLQEKAAPSLGKLTDSLSLFDNYRVLQSASDDYSQWGITTANSGAANAPLLKALSWAARLRLLPFRLVVSPRHDAFGEQILNGQFDPDDLNSEWFQVGPIKLFADGSPQGYTAYLTEPYFKQPPGQAGYRGFPGTEQSRLIETVSKYQRAGIQLAIHGNGDAAIDNIIEAISLSGQVNADDARTILLHAQMTRVDQLDDMKLLGITPSFFNTHTYYWGDVHSKNVMGPDRAARISPAGSAEKIGLRFSFHSDAPVTPINPLQLIWSGVNRETLEGNVLGEAERVSIMSALRAVTIDAAWQVFQEDNRGSVEVGKFADLVILSGDLLSDKQTIRGRQVLETLVAGETVFSATQ